MKPNLIIFFLKMYMAKHKIVQVQQSPILSRFLALFNCFLFLKLKIHSKDKIWGHLNKYDGNVKGKVPQVFWPMKKLLPLSFWHFFAIFSLPFYVLYPPQLFSIILLFSLLLLLFFVILLTPLTKVSWKYCNTLVYARMPCIYHMIILFEVKK